MSICSGCGSEVNDNWKVCPNCGKTVGVSTPQSESEGFVRYILNGEVDRRASAHELFRTIEYFEEKQDLYDEYDRLSRQDIPMTSNSIFFNWYWFKVIWLIYILVVPVLFCFGFLTKWILFPSDDLLTTGIFIILCIAVFIVSLLPSVLYVIFQIVKIKKKKKLLAELLERRAVVANELAENFRNFGYCVVGMEYTNPRILKRILGMIQDGRADTPKEALNTLINDHHNAIMRMKAEQTAIAANAAARYARSTAEYAESAATAAWFCYADLLFR